MEEDEGNYLKTWGNSMLKWMYYVKPKTPRDDYVLWEDPEDTEFTKVLRKALMRWSIASRSPVMPVLYRPWIMIGETITEQSPLRTVL